MSIRFSGCVVRGLGAGEAGLGAGPFLPPRSPPCPGGSDRWDARRCVGEDCGELGDGRPGGAAGAWWVMVGSDGECPDGPVVTGDGPGVPGAGACATCPGAAARTGAASAVPAGAPCWVEACALRARGTKVADAGRWGEVRGSAAARSAAAADVDRETAGRPLRPVGDAGACDRDAVRPPTARATLGAEGRPVAADACGAAGARGAEKAASARIACSSAARPAGVISWRGAVPDFCCTTWVSSWASRRRERSVVRGAVPGRCTTPSVA